MPSGETECVMCGEELPLNPLGRCARCQSKFENEDDE